MMKRIKRKIFYAENTDVYPGIIARNNAVVEYQKFLHRTYYSYIIHPYSTFRVTYERIAIVVIPIRLFALSFVWAAFPHEAFIFQAFVFSFQVYNMIDIGLNFFTGYVESRTEVAVLEPRRIVKHYFMTNFMLDLLPSIPVELIYTLVQGKKSNAIGEVIVDLLCHFLYLRYFAFLKYFNNLSKIMLWNVFFVGLVSVCLGVSFILLVANNMYHISCIHSLLEHGRNHTGDIRFYPIFSESVLDDIAKYLDEFSFLIFDCLFFETKVPSSYIYVRSMVLVSTFFTKLIFTTFFIKYVMLKMTPKEKFLDLESRILTFVRIKHLPRALECKILLYFQIVLENKACREDEIFDYIPDTFKADIFFQLCLPLLRHFYAFEDLPTYILRRLAECMRYQLYLPNDIVLRKDDPTIRMYFVQRGTVALYSPQHVELYHFESGNSFNGRNVILGESMFGYYAISLEVSEVYWLDGGDFMDIMKSYPAQYRAVKQKILKDKSLGSYAT